MKVLQINCVYNNGSTGKITYNIHTELLKYGIESVVCYGRGEKNKEPNIYKISSEFYAHLNQIRARVTGIIYGGCWLSTQKLIYIIKNEKPDIVHLQCINGYFVNIYKLIEWLKKNNIKTVLTLHAEFMYTGGCGYALDCTQWSTNEGCGHSMKCPLYQSEFHSYLDCSYIMWKKMKKAFDNFNDNLIITSVSSWLMERAKKSPIMHDKKHVVIYNGVDISVFHVYPPEIKERKVIFHASPYFNDTIDHIKGGYYVLELAKKMPNVHFVVAGTYFIKNKVPENVTLLGRITDQKELARWYSKADLTLLTSKRETFSMICAESLCCGTPVVGFKAGAPEQIALEKYSEFVDYGNLDMLEKVVRKWLDKGKKEIIANDAKEKYSKEVMTQNYIEIYNRLIRGSKHEI